MQSPPIEPAVERAQQIAIHKARFARDSDASCAEPPEHREIIRDFRAGREHAVYNPGVLQRAGFVFVFEAEQSSARERREITHQTDPLRTQISARKPEENHTLRFEAAEHPVPRRRNQNHGLRAVQSHGV